MPRQSQLSPVDGLAQLSFLVLGMLERRAGEHGLSMAQTRLLGILRDRRPSMNELAALLQLDKSSVTGLVGRAQDRGLVARVRSDADRRSASVELTAAGRQVTDQVTGLFAQDATALLAKLPAADRRILTALIGRLLIAEGSSRGIDVLSPGRG